MKRIIPPVQVILIFVIVLRFLFIDLGKVPFRIWDESRLVTSSYEMTHNHRYLTPTIENFPDMWSTKPPMMIWAQAASIDLFGLSEWSARLPAAMSGMFIVFLTVWFVRKLISDRWLWMVPAIVLCTSTGFIGYHTVRSAEYDGMLTLFTTAFLFSFFAYTEGYGSRRNNYLILFFIFLTLACLTKGIAGLLFTPALLLYLIIRKQFVATLSNKYTYIGLLCFVLFVAGYYFLREQFNQGYIQAVSENEWGARFSAPIQGAAKSPWFLYLDIIRWEQFSTWRWALFASIVLIWFLEGKVFRAALFCWLCAIVFISVLSISGTKYSWYDLPVFPVLAVLVSLVIFQLSRVASGLFGMNQQWALVSLIIIFSIQPLWQAHNFILFQGDNLTRDNFYAPSYYLRDALEGKRDLSGATFLMTGYNIQWRLYVKMLNDRGIHIRDGVPPGKKFGPGDRLIVNQPDVEHEIEKNYNYKLTEEYYGVKNYLITSGK